MRLLIKAALWLALLGLLQLSAAYAREKSGITRDQAVRIATNRYPGKVVKIVAGKHHYQIRVLENSGRVVIVKVNKVTGKII